MNKNNLSRKRAKVEIKKIDNILGKELLQKKRKNSNDIPVKNSQESTRIIKIDLALAKERAIADYNLIERRNRMELLLFKEKIERDKRMLDDDFSRFKEKIEREKKKLDNDLLSFKRNIESAKIASKEKLNNELKRLDLYLSIFEKYE